MSVPDSPLVCLSKAGISSASQSAKLIDTQVFALARTQERSNRNQQSILRSKLLLTTADANVPTQLERNQVPFHPVQAQNDADLSCSSWVQRLVPFVLVHIINTVEAVEEGHTARSLDVANSSSIAQKQPNV